MQPPPRKVRVTQELKHTHGEQLNRLHVKHQAECDLLEDLRTFSQKRASVERDYAQALQKLANQYLKREWPDSLSDEADHRNMYCVWRAYLEGTVQVTQSRINACDNYKAQVAEPAKTARLQKEQQLRKCIERLTSIQAELQESVKDLTKSRKKYQEAETMAQAVRERAELEAKSKLSLFQSKSSLQRATVKLKAKRSECISKATHCRNDYLLTLAAANAHQQRYYDTDLSICLKALDGRTYEQVKDYLVSLCQTELESYQAVHDVFNKLLDSSNGVVQEFHQQMFVQKNPIFQRAADFSFQPIDTDTVTHLLRESGTAEEHSLDKEARKWASRVAREYKSIIHTQRVLEEFGAQESSEQNGGELEAKMEVARENLRRAETVKAKAEARLDLLREAGVSVETWLKSAMNQVMEELENERWNNLSGHDSSLSGTADLEREEDEEMEDSGEVLDDSSSSPSSTLKNYPLTCKVLYSYKASQPDELTIEEQEILEVIDDGDMEDWVKAKNRSGQVGYVPEKYLQLPSSNSLLSMLQSLAALDARSHSSSNSTEPETELPTGSVNGDASVSFAKALYDYAGQTDDELSFPEGAIIRILSRETHEDDGFWEGEFNGVVGVFPAVLVEDLAGGAGENGTPAQYERSPRSPFHSGPLHSSPLQTPTASSSPHSSPCSATASPVGRPPAYHNGHHRPPPGTPHKSPFHSPGQGSPQPPKYPDSGSGTIRPVRAAPPPPKQHPRGQVKRREEVEITLV
ncbi:F-BAR and double SH3 domains protein 2-like [Corythoichthys intestinalis]|uniref:F-BAR and double SH3 domains protein 2-like n=1 Tax=Corythoichthys intestinalis TaxID=161448 RepID=UPI0025A4F83E|nr:F-BAR and double SH3 domains protein 2-like [Corythoichthys intestinalis]XP_061801489.1 F-BAR and double SH3 domains protein 2-like [Nerophis lumbriciformis]